MILVITGGILFILGLILCVTRSNTILILAGIELMLNAANLNLIGFGKSTEAPANSLFITAVAAAETAVLLAIILQVYRRFRTTDLDQISENQP